MILYSEWSRNFQSYCWENIIVFLRWCKLYINNYMKEDHRSYRRNCKRLSFPSCKSCVYNCDDLPPYNSSPLSSHIWFSYIHNFIRKQFHSVNGTEISHMKKWREPKSLSARLIPVFKHCEHLCVGIYIVRSNRNNALLKTTHHTQSQPSQKSYYNLFRISL